MPKLSVAAIVPLYNQRETVCEAIESVLAQTRPCGNSNWWMTARGGVLWPVRSLWWKVCKAARGWNGRRSV